MEKALNFVLYWLSYLFFVAVDAFLGWWILSEFDLSYSTWFGIAVVAIALVRSANVLGDIYDNLTKKEVAPPVDRRGIL